MAATFSATTGLLTTMQSANACRRRRAVSLLFHKPQIPPIPASIRVYLLLLTMVIIIQTGSQSPQVTIVKIRCKP